MRITFLGTCSGTEPMPGRRHASVAVEAAGKVYLFDAGEGCSHTAHNLGIDLLALTKVIISHPHIDHIGGLANLVWVPRKLTSRTKIQPYHGELELYLPDLAIWDAVDHILRVSGRGRISAICPKVHKVQKGLVFDDGTLRVTAYENTHIAREEGECLSYSYLIEGEGKRVVYSGDVKIPAELEEAVGAHCDLLMMETGHHKIDDVFAFASQKSIDALYFTHHGREILGDVEGACKRVAALWNGKAHIAFDGLRVEL